MPFNRLRRREFITLLGGTAAGERPPFLDFALACQVSPPVLLQNAAITASVGLWVGTNWTILTWRGFTRARLLLEKSK
jgi:hypothetical protein